MLDSASDSQAPDIEALMKDGVLIDAAIERGVRDALREHKLFGNPVPIWENGKVVWIPPEDIPVDEEFEG